MSEPLDPWEGLKAKVREAQRMIADGSEAAAVSLITGLSRERLDEIGGFRDHRFEDPRSDEGVPELHRTTEYLLLGHPAWPGNLSTSDPAHARRWYLEHRDSGHPIFVDKVVKFRRTLTDAQIEGLA